MRMYGNIVKARAREAGDAAIERCAYLFTDLVSHAGLGAQAQVPLAVVRNYPVRSHQRSLGGDGRKLRGQGERPAALREEAQQVGIGLQGEFAPLRGGFQVPVVPAVLVQHRCHVPDFVGRHPVGAAVQGELVLAAQL